MGYEYSLYYVKKRKRGKAKKLKTNIYIVQKDSERAWAERLGIIKWRGAWRQYVFYPDNDSFWSSKCLSTVVGFLDEVNRKWREKKRKEKEARA